MSQTGTFLFKKSFYWVVCDGQSHSFCETCVLLPQAPNPPFTCVLWSDFGLFWFSGHEEKASQTLFQSNKMRKVSQIPACIRCTADNSVYLFLRFIYMHENQSTRGSLFVRCSVGSNLTNGLNRETIFDTVFHQQNNLDSFFAPQVNKTIRGASLHLNIHTAINEPYWDFYCSYRFHPGHSDFHYTCEVIT